MATDFLIAAVLFGAATGQASDDASGKALYDTHCGVCHQVDGWGVPFMQPALVDSPRVLGDADQMLEMVFLGSAAIPEGTSEYDNQMPNFAGLKDEEIARIASYVRQKLAGQSKPVTVERVTSARKRFLGSTGIGAF